MKTEKLHPQVKTALESFTTQLSKAYLMNKKVRFIVYYSGHTEKYHVIMENDVSTSWMWKYKGEYKYMEAQMPNPKLANQLRDRLQRVWDNLDS